MSKRKTGLAEQKPIIFSPPPTTPASRRAMAELAVVAEFAKLAPELAKMHRDNFDFIEGKVEKYMDFNGDGKT